MPRPLPLPRRARCPCAHLSSARCLSLPPCATWPYSYSYSYSYSLLFDLPGVGSMGIGRWTLRLTTYSVRDGRRNGLSYIWAGRKTVLTSEERGVFRTDGAHPCSVATNPQRPGTGTCVPTHPCTFVPPLLYLYFHGCSNPMSNANANVHNIILIDSNESRVIRLKLRV
jgi:hypothetical protein